MFKAKLSNSIQGSNTKSKNLRLNNNTVNSPSAASLYTSTPYKQDNSFLIIGERLNASGSKKARDLLNTSIAFGYCCVLKSAHPSPR